MIKLVIAFIQPPKSKFRGLDFTPIHTPLISNSTLLLQQKQFFIFFSVNSSNGINKVRNIQCSSLKDSLIAPEWVFRVTFLILIFCCVNLFLHAEKKESEYSKVSTFGWKWLAPNFLSPHFSKR